MAEKIGRSWVTVSADNGTDQSGLPRGTGLLAACAGRAIGLTAPTSTLSVGPLAASSDRMSMRDDVAATVSAMPKTAHSTANPVGLSHPDIKNPLRQPAAPARRRGMRAKLVPIRLVINPHRFWRPRTGTSIFVLHMLQCVDMLPSGHGRCDCRRNRRDP